MLEKENDKNEDQLKGRKEKSYTSGNWKLNRKRE